MLSGKRLLTYNEWIQAALGSPQGLAGNVWEWLADVIATGSGTDGWQNVVPGYGQLWTFGDFRALIAGGSYFNGSWCGSRTVSTLYPPWDGHASFGARGACSSL